MLTVPPGGGALGMRYKLHVELFLPEKTVSPGTRSPARGGAPESYIQLFIHSVNIC